MNPETLLLLESDSDLPTARSLEVSRSRYYRHVRHPSPDGLAEVSVHICIQFHEYLTRTGSVL